MSKPTKIHNKSVGSGGFGSDGDGIEAGRGDGGNGGCGLGSEGGLHFQKSNHFLLFWCDFPLS
jgi:hypothetical protein